MIFVRPHDYIIAHYCSIATRTIRLILFVYMYNTNNDIEKILSR